MTLKFTVLSSLLRNQFNKNIVFSISLLSAIFTSMINLPKLEYINFNVIICLFELMIVIKIIEECGMLKYIAVRIASSCKNHRSLTQALCLISFFTSMFITNDIAILTIIPILIVISQRSNYPIIFPCVLLTISANLGSSITPIGNPQNLFIYAYYKMNFLNFLSLLFPFFLLSLLLLISLTFIIKKEYIQISIPAKEITDKYFNFSLISLFTVLIILSMSNTNFATFTVFSIIIITLLSKRSLLTKLDYRLLLTFLFLFVAIGNISAMPLVKMYLPYLTHTAFQTYLLALFLSQLISNVPCTVMLAPFSNHLQALLYGVNVGGLGTPIASLASIITFTLFNNAHPQKSGALIKAYSILNFSSLIILGSLFYIILLYF
ncbi:SLC13 family permease [Pectinatus haikarae]|uniref:Na+/H+ antiporter NhaD/arsenite permease-like protein n=1 Tax=Pectinatus haikarae TaxID=349096 RepID=A0ABT9Y9T9_9FIRM|nr:SLC13 family permease [Pectinatus haikarae]MDQ0204606.1 Na+/H+ antiporter NhaD/arsenite permease-like protein [Pectinatus haikarae]